VLADFHSKGAWDARRASAERRRRRLKAKLATMKVRTMNDPMREAKKEICGT